MCLLNHDHIVNFEGACIERKIEDSTFMIVTELMQRGSLKKILNGAPLPIDKTIKYGLHIALGMDYIHQFGIIHRDLKCDNILVNDEDIAKVADLGLAREIDIDKGMTIMAGTPKWEAPEVLYSKKGRVYDKPADVYSYAMTLFEMISGEDPFKEIHDIFELKKAVVDKGKRPKLPKNIPKKLKSLIEKCWSKEIETRLPFHKIITTLNEISSE